MRNTSSTPPDSAGKLTIGALSRATGIPIETLRTWELRYGYPVSKRKRSGHRLYALSVVSRLRRIAEALQRGHRAGEVVPATDAELDGLAAAVTSDVRSEIVTLPAAATSDQLLHLVESFEADRLTAVLLADWGRLSPVAFVTTRIGPLIAGVGDGWASGRFEIRHEHVLSERVGDLLRSLRLAFDLRATGPRVICGTLPGEPHGLGLQMAALVFAAAGWRVTYLGTDIPPRELATLASDLSARAIALSVSSASDQATTSAHLAQLRRALPKGVTVLLGGSGARAAKGMVIMGHFDQLDHWARRVAAGLGPISTTEQWTSKR
jgi:MerR family transcriptional regulator, light-induced transcriptional regulator